MPAALKFNNLGTIEVDPDGTMTVGTTSAVSPAEQAITSLDGVTYALG